jgi:integrase
MPSAWPGKTPQTSPPKPRKPSVHQASEIQVWADEVIACLIDAHPDSLRVLPELAASCGMREGELYGVALEDFGFDEKVVRVRRQVKRLDDLYVFALPKNDRERIIPLSDWDIQAVRRHVTALNFRGLCPVVTGFSDR